VYPSSKFPPPEVATEVATEVAAEYEHGSPVLNWS